MTTTWQALARLCRYPDDDMRPEMRAMIAGLEEEASSRIREFLEATDHVALEDLQEQYTVAFDFDPVRSFDLLDLTGTKYGCGLGLCGACTVHVDGKAVRSCQTTLKSVEGRQVVTIESLKGEHPVQKAWMDANVPQCGYCQSGQIMQAIALLKEKPKPTDADIDSAMQGNICRCGTYQRIRQAIKQAAGVNA